MRVSTLPKMGGTPKNHRTGCLVCDMNGVLVPSTLAQAQREYLENRVLSAKPVEVVEMLYQVAIQSLNRALEHLRSGDALARAQEVSRAQDAVNELMAALDHSVAAFTQTLAALYIYVQQQIVKGHFNQSEEAFQKASAILTTLLEGWAGVRAEVMQTSTAVTAAPEVAPELEPSPPASPGVKDVSTEYQQAAPVGSRDWNC